jgi:hypothetical protein
VHLAAADREIDALQDLLAVDGHMEALDDEFLIGEFFAERCRGGHVVHFFLR